MPDSEGQSAPADAQSRDELFAAAATACRQAHAPYSQLKVGAAIRSLAGALYTGCNVENASFPLGNCAESSAIAAGVRQEGQSFRIAAIAVHAEDRLGRRRPAPPCGGCRQRIREFAVGPQLPVHFVSRADGQVTLDIATLLPFSFEFPGGDA